MKKLLVVLLMPLMSLAQGGQGFTMMAPSSGSGFVIKGSLTGVKDSTEVVLRGGSTGNIVAKDKVKKGVFTLKGKLTEPDIFQVSFSGHQQVLDLFIFNDNITVSGNLAEPASIQVKGSATETDYELFKASFNPLFEELRTKVQLINAEKNAASRDSLIKQYSVVRTRTLTNAERFAREKPSSAVSSLALFAVMPLFENVEDLETAYRQLLPSARRGSFAREIEKKFIGKVGSRAIDFTQKDVDGKPVSLASFRGKYVLVDFWASWCKPCRMENPNVVTAYQSYKDRNFTVLGVSLDQSKPNWLAAIKSDNLTWTHVSDLQYWNNAVAQLYGIQSIPANLLIDPNGKIIARDIRGEELQNKLKEILK